MAQNPFPSPLPAEIPHEDGDVATAPARPAVRRPSMWQVVMLNDDFTPMDFVVAVLGGVFDHPIQKAVELMLQVHRSGRAVVGVYSREVAQAKQAQAQAVAQAHGHPLRVELERQAEDPGQP